MKNLTFSEEQLFWLSEGMELMARKNEKKIDLSKMRSDIRIEAIKERKIINKIVVIIAIAQGR